MNIIDFKLKDKQSFEGTVVHWKNRYQMTGSFKTSFQDYPEDMDAPLYASTVQYKLLDEQGAAYDPTEEENQELESILDDKIDSELEANPHKYAR